MSIKRLFVPDNLLSSSTQRENKNIQLLQYTNATTHENFDAFLTNYALVYILSGTKRIKMAESKFDIHAGELLLIPRGEYVMSEYIAGEKGFKSFMLFFNKKTAQQLMEQIDKALLEEYHSTDYSQILHTNTKKEAIKIIPLNKDIEQVFATLEKYSQNGSAFQSELIHLKFTELIYLLLDSPYKTTTLRFLFEASRSEPPTLSTVLDNHLYSSSTIEELAILSGRSLSSFKREFIRQYNEPPRTWIRKKKLEHAAFLLHTSDKNIKEITDASGFASPPHFTRLFKQYYLATPAEYRAKQTKH